MNGFIGMYYSHKYRPISVSSPVVDCELIQSEERLSPFHRLIRIFTEPIPLRFLAGQNSNDICPVLLDSIEQVGGKKGRPEVTGVAHNHASIQLGTGALVLDTRNGNPIVLNLNAGGGITGETVCAAHILVIAVVGGPVDSQPAGAVTDRAVEFANGVIEFEVVGAGVIAVDIGNIGRTEGRVAGTVPGNELSAPVGGPIPRPGIANRNDEIIVEQTSREGDAATALGKDDETDASVRVLRVIGDRSLSELGLDDAFRLVLGDVIFRTDGLGGQPEFWTAFAMGVEVWAGQSFRFDGGGVGVEESEDFRSNRMHSWKVGTACYVWWTGGGGALSNKKASHGPQPRWTLFRSGGSAPDELYFEEEPIIGKVIKSPRRKWRTRLRPWLSPRERWRLGQFAVCNGKWVSGCCSSR